MTSPDGTKLDGAKPARGFAAARPSTSGAGLFVAVGDGGTVLSSPDGTNWAYRYSSPETTFLRRGLWQTGSSSPSPTRSPTGPFSLPADGVVWEKSGVLY